MTAHTTHVWSPTDPKLPCFAACDCGFLVRCYDHDSALEAGREHLESLETDREHVLAAQIRRDLLRLEDALELVTALRRAIDTAEKELADIDQKAGAA